MVNTASREWDVILINARFSDSAVTRRLGFPLGILYLGAILELNGFRIHLLDYDLTDKSPDDIAEDIRDFPAPVYAITSLITGYTFVKKLVPIIRAQAPKSTILLGGPITYSIAEFMLHSLAVDMLVEGEAEGIIVPLVRSILDQSLEPVPGVSYRRNGIVIPSVMRQQVMDLDKIPISRLGAPGHGKLYHQIPEFLAQSWNAHFLHPCLAGLSLSMYRAADIEVCTNIMVNFPGETEETFRETVDFMKDHRLYTNFSITTALPGTRLFEEALAEGTIDDMDAYLDSLSDGILHKLSKNFTELSDERVIELRDAAKLELFDNRVVWSE